MIEIMERVAIEAGLEILRLRKSDLQYEVKRDRSERSAADTTSEKLIITRLLVAFPGVDVVAEEAVSDGGRWVPIGHRFFLIDKLDGTREFKAGSSEFTVNISLIEDKWPVLGVMFAPAKGMLYSTRLSGATRTMIDKFGQQTHSTGISCREFDPRRSVGMVSRSRPQQANQYLASLTISEVMQVGSALKFCRVAERLADIYPSLGSTMEWDTAADDAILSAAGGEVISLGDFQPLQYGGSHQKKPFLNPPFVARSRSMGKWLDMM